MKMRQGEAGGAFLNKSAPNSGYPRFYFAIHKNAYSGQWEFYHVADDGKIAGDGAVYSSPLPTMDDNTWHHVAMAKNGSTIRFYLDGVYKGGGQSSDYFNAQVPLTIGNNIGGGGWFLSEFRIFENAKSQVGVNDYKTVFYDYMYPNLRGYWRFNELKGQIVEDESRFNNDGFLGVSQQADAYDPLPSAAPFTRDNIDLAHQSVETDQTPLVYNATVKRITACQSIHVAGNFNAASGSQIDVVAGSSITIDNYADNNFTTAISPGFSFSIAPCGLKNGRIGTVVEDLQLESLDEKILAYPNPTADKVTIELLFEPTTHADIQVYNTLGKQVSLAAAKIINAQQYELDLKDHPSGLYLIRVATDQGWVTKKIILER